MHIDEIKCRLWDDCTKAMYPIIGFDLKRKRVVIDRGGGLGRIVLLDPIRYDVMWFSGLIDKNSVDIYGGDIILTFGYTTKVVWKFGSFGIAHPVHGFLPLSNHPRLDESCCMIGRCGVIGNIYENLELLRGGSA